MTAVPEVRLRPRSAEDLYIVLACDGVWDVMTNEDMGAFIQGHGERQERGEQSEGEGGDEAHYLALLSDDIVKESMRRGSRDNITALVVRLALGASPERTSRALFT